MHQVDFSAFNSPLHLKYIGLRIELTTLLLSGLFPPKSDDRLNYTLGQVPCALFFLLVRRRREVG